MSTWVIITAAEIVAALVGFVIGTMYPGALTRPDEEDDTDDRDDDVCE